MFTGIIETIGKVVQMETQGTNKTFWIQSSLFSQLKTDQSLSHDGACLTIEELKDGLHKVTTVEETLKKTTLKQWQVGYNINLERSLLLNSRLDGHFVQGHVDGIGVCKKIKDLNGSWNLEFAIDKKFGTNLIEKGSICINGISLTAFNVRKKSFTVAIIPYTLKHTNLKYLKPNDTVNLEFDLIGKYIHRKLSLKG